MRPLWSSSERDTIYGSMYDKPTLPLNTDYFHPKYTRIPLHAVTKARAELPYYSAEPSGSGLVNLSASVSDTGQYNCHFFCDSDNTFVNKLGSPALKAASDFAMIMLRRVSLVPLIIAGAFLLDFYRAYSLASTTAFSKLPFLCSWECLQGDTFKQEELETPEDERRVKRSIRVSSTGVKSVKEPQAGLARKKSRKSNSKAITRLHGDRYEIWMDGGTEQIPGTRRGLV
ncbi:hypothetical protein GQ44DRAFT_765053 [Phaeosphaeriaceae sp. PMI808]|nr:hypothetical protein GQ44DRAFT_765053 [Phaeosphaeriaceae sp. PMI808]